MSPSRLGHVRAASPYSGDVPTRPPRRDRHGRGPRGDLLPAGVPAALTRSERFDELVLDAVEHLPARWAPQLSAVEVAVEDVPPLALDLGPDPTVVDDTHLLDEHGVPLSRVVAAGSDRRARPTPARLVVYRRPLEARARDRTDLAVIVHDVVVEQLAVLLNVEPDVLDPGYGSDDD